jgi:hypothetical protein
MEAKFYYSKSRLVLYAAICTALSLILVSIFFAAISSVPNAKIYVSAFVAVLIYIAVSLAKKFIGLFYGKAPAITILDDRVVLQGIRNEVIPFSSIQAVKLVRPSGPDGTVGFYALHFELFTHLENGQRKSSTVSISLPLIKANRTELLGLIQTRISMVQSSAMAND